MDGGLRKSPQRRRVSVTNLAARRRLDGSQTGAMRRQSTLIIKLKYIHEVTTYLY